MKKCSRCGEVKPLSEFRPYYNRKSGTYTYCRTCEKIAQRYKYLQRKSALTDAEQLELSKIELLYKCQKEAGLAVPGKGRPIGVSSIVDARLEALNEDL